MSDVISAPAPQTTGDEMDWEQMLAGIRQMNEQMQKDQVRIDRAKIETEGLRGENEILRQETARLRTETRATLARMGCPL